VQDQKATVGTNNLHFLDTVSLSSEKLSEKMIPRSCIAGLGILVLLIIPLLDA
jgi:hypothetical protein